jgi:hypothetical protein
MPKRGGGELGFSKIYCENEILLSHNSPLVPTSVPSDFIDKSFAP